MVTFDMTPYGVRVSVDGGTANELVDEVVAAKHWDTMAPGFHVLVDMRKAPVLTQDEFQRLGGFLMARPNHPTRIGVIVSSAVVALQIRRLFRAVGLGPDVVEVFDGDDAAKGLPAALDFVA